MENWSYLALNKNANIFNLKASDHEHYALKSISLNESKSPHCILVKHDSLTLGTEKLIHQHSWHIHLSIQPQDLPVAWDIIFPILAKHRIDMFKVVNLAAIDKDIKEADDILLAYAINKSTETNGETQRRQRDHAKVVKDNLVSIKEGSQVTIYTIPDLEYQYRLALNELEYALLENNIRAGKFNGIDRVIGVYTSVRYIAEADVTSRLSKSYNPQNVSDPFYPLAQISFINEVRKIVKDKKVKNKRKLTKILMLEQFKLTNNILVLQDVFRFLQSKDSDFLRRKRKIMIMPFNTEQSFALRKILKEIKRRVLEIAKNQHVITSMEAAAIREILSDKRNQGIAGNQRYMRKFEKLQKKGIIRVI